jgi:hypothetical protein
VARPWGFIDTGELGKIFFPFSEIYDHKQLFGKYAFTFWSSLLHRWNALASCGILGGLGLWDSSISTILNVFNGF